MTPDMQIALLATVNAPYRIKLDASELADALTSHAVTLGQVSSFFMETPISAQRAFAKDHGISIDALDRVALAFQDYSGQRVALIA